jgi:nucleoside phosphorylase
MINILVALNAEAKSIRQVLKLRALQDSAPWRCYVNDRYRLLVTGTGSLNMAMATSWLFGAYGSASLWVNIGSAGHKTAEVGSVVIANKIVDSKSGQTWFIPILVNGISSGTVCTFERAKVEFSDLNFYDMEAAGFIQAALRVTERERIHSIKIVSDNDIERSGDLDELRLMEIIEAATETVLTRLQQIIDSLGSGAVEIMPKSKTSQEYFNLGKLRHISSAQEHRWRELKRCWSAVGWSIKSLRQTLDSHKSTTDFLDWMESELHSKPISLERKP